MDTKSDPDLLAFVSFLLLGGTLAALSQMGK